MNDDLLDRLQSDVHGILMATPSLALARKINDNAGDLEGELENMLSTLTGDGGRSGLAVIVLAPTVTNALENLPGPPLEVRVDVQCIELVELNRSQSDGTGIRSSTAATRVLAALQHTALGSHALYADDRPIKPLTTRTGYVSHLVSVRTTLNGLPSNKTLPVTDTWDGDALTLECDTPGAVIRYTTDGSFPGPGNDAALVYQSEVAGLPTGTLVRFAATAPDKNPGDVGEHTITP